MSFSVSSSASFSSINWTTFEGRPEIKDSMPFCKEKDWDQDKKCCMDGYSIEHALEMIPKLGMKSSEARFLEQYPCVNGLELESLVEGASEPKNSSTETVNRRTSIVEDGGSCDSRAVKAFLKFIKSVGGYDDIPEISSLKKGLKISCEALIDMAVRYGRASR
jgi:hypothetical protein